MARLTILHQTMTPLTMPDPTDNSTLAVPDPTDEFSLEV